MKDKLKILALITASLVLTSCQDLNISQLKTMVQAFKTEQKVQENEITSDITEDENLAQDSKIYQEVFPEESEEEIEESEVEVSESEESLEPEEKETEEDHQTKFVAGGDIMFHMNQVRAAQREDGTYDFKSSFDYVRPYLEKGFAIGNFETTIGDEEVSAYPLFWTPKESLEAVKSAGFDLVALANNHSLDGGLAGVTRTLDTAHANDFKTTGTFKIDDTQALPSIINIDGRDIAFLNYTYGLNGLDPWLEGNDHMINRLDEDKILKDIAYAKDHARGTVAIVHWGTEYMLERDDNQAYWARFLAENGVDIILGSHPHVVQGAEFIDHEGFKTYCIYSMGNFISDQRREFMDDGSPYSEDGVLIELDIKGQGDRIYVERASHYPTWVGKTTDPLAFTIYPCHDILDGKIEASDLLRSRAQESFDRTRVRLAETMDSKEN